MDKYGRLVETKINVKPAQNNNKFYTVGHRCSGCHFMYFIQMGWRECCWECPYCGKIEKYEK